MANPSGVTNGTGVILQIYTGSEYVEVCGESSHSATFNTENIDTTNKCSDQYRTLLSGEGTQSIDISLDALYSNDPAFVYLRERWHDKTPVAIQRVIGSLTLDSDVMVQNMSDTAGLNESVSTSFTLQSTGSFTEA